MKNLKLLILSIILMFCFCSPALAYYGNMTSDVDRNSLDNYGVNKKWLIGSNNLENVLNTPKVDASKQVYDYSDILSDSEEEEIRTLAKKFKDKYKMDMVILTIDYPYTYDKANDDMAADFYDYNDFGIDFEGYSGIVLYRNTYSLDPFFDMQTYGTAQFYFNQYRYDDVLDGIYPQLKNHHYLEGFKNFINYCDKYVSSGRPYEYVGAELGENNEVKYNYDSLEYKKAIFKAKMSASIFPAIVVSLIVTIVIVGVLAGRNKMVIKATAAADYLDRNSFALIKSQDQFLTTHTTSYRIDTSSGGSGGGGGGHSSFGSSGGGHSSGGGRHG